MTALGKMGREKTDAEGLQCRQTVSRWDLLAPLHCWPIFVGIYKFYILQKLCSTLPVELLFYVTTLE